MSPRLESVLSLLARNPRGLRAEEIREQLGITRKPLERALDYLQSVEAVCIVRVGLCAHWVAAEHRATAEACAEKCKQDTRRREALRKQRYQPKPAESALDAWTPPGPRIPSVWHLPQVMGLA